MQDAYYSPAKNLPDPPAKDLPNAAKYGPALTVPAAVVGITVASTLFMVVWRIMHEEVKKVCFSSANPKHVNNDLSLQQL